MIESYKIYHITKPLKRKMVNSMYTADSVYNVILEVSDGTCCGYGYVFSYKRRHQLALSLLIEDYMSMIIGQSAEESLKLWDSIRKSNANIGDTGLSARALSIVDSAIWDLRAREAGLPLYKLIGGSCTEIPLYVGGGWLDLSEQQLVDEMLGCLEKGYKAYKFKICAGDNSKHERRVAAVRRAAGDKVELMVDANQGFSFDEAKDMASRLADYKISWFEEPFPAYQIEDYKRLHKDCPVRIAAGESLYLLREQKPFISSHAYDVVMPDLARTAGPTEFMRICDVAEAEGLPVSSHWFTEICAHLISRCKKSCVIEYVEDIWDDVFSEAPKIVNGSMILSDTPGTGISLDYDAIEFYKTKD